MIKMMDGVDDAKRDLSQALLESDDSDGNGLDRELRKGEMDGAKNHGLKIKTVSFTMRGKTDEPASKENSAARNDKLSLRGR